MEQWLANMAHIESHNFNYALGHKTYSLGMNHYGDLSSTEFAAQYNGFLNSKRGMHLGEDYTEHEEDDKARVFLVIFTNFKISEPIWMIETSKDAHWSN